MDFDPLFAGSPGTRDCRSADGAKLMSVPSYEFTHICTSHFVFDDFWFLRLCESTVNLRAERRVGAKWSRRAKKRPTVGRVDTGGKNGVLAKNEKFGVHISKSRRWKYAFWPIICVAREHNRNLRHRAASKMRKTGNVSQRRFFRIPFFKNVEFTKKKKT